MADENPLVQLDKALAKLVNRAALSPLFGPALCALLAAWFVYSSRAERLVVGGIAVAWLLLWALVPVFRAWWLEALECRANRPDERNPHSAHNFLNPDAKDLVWCPGEVRFF
jgi:hypothetical protein